MWRWGGCTHMHTHARTRTYTHTYIHICLLPEMKPHKTHQHTKQTYKKKRKKKYHFNETTTPKGFLEVLRWWFGSCCSFSLVGLLSGVFAEATRGRVRISLSLTISFQEELSIIFLVLLSLFIAFSLFLLLSFSPTLSFFLIPRIYHTSTESLLVWEWAADPAHLKRGEHGGCR